jgi:ribosomal protein S18 acetylase RimI-like enzyme
MSRVDVRPWTEDDLPAVREITWETWLATYVSLVRVEDLKSYFDDHYSLEALVDFFRRPECGGLLATADGEPAGYARTRLSAEEGRFYVTSLYVLPRFQGLGLGTRLLDLSARAALARGSTKIWLGVMTGNTRTVEWYRRLGFAFVEELPFTMGSTTVPHLIGYKTLESYL